MTSRIKAIAAFVSLAALVSSLSGCQGDAENPGDPTRDENIAESVASRPRVRVRTQPIESRPFVEHLEVTGRLEPWEEVVVSSELGGLVREVGFEKGDWVDAGDVLARIGDDIAEAQLAQARADLLAAKANFTKITKLFERQAVPQQDLVQATSQRDRSQAVVREMELRLERSVVRAPIGGWATERPIDAGEVIGPGTRVTTLQQVERLKVAASVPDREIGWLAEAREAEIEVDAYPDRTFEGRLHYIAPAASEASRSFAIELSLRNPRNRLRPGMVARVRLVKRQIERGLVIPIDAMVTRESGPVIFVVDGCFAREIVLRDYAIEDDDVFVETGVVDGEELVVDGQRELIDGQEVVSESCP